VKFKEDRPLSAPPRPLRPISPQRPKPPSHRPSAGAWVRSATLTFDASTFSGHSLRSGFLTSAAGKGASIFKMMDVSRHKSVDTLRGYVRDAELFKDHAGAGLL
jgi:integrase